MIIVREARFLNVIQREIPVEPARQGTGARVTVLSRAGDHDAFTGADGIFFKQQAFG